MRDMLDQQKSIGVHLQALFKPVTNELERMSGAALDRYRVAGRMAEVTEVWQEVMLKEQV